MKGDLTSESEEEWKEGSNDEFEAEIEPDVVPKKRNTYQDQKTALLETDDEEEDTEEIRERRRREKRNLHDLIMEQLNKEEVVDPRVFVPDQTDDALLKKWLLAPLMKNSKNYMRFGKKEKDRVKQLVMEGHLFKDKNTKELGEYAQTASAYLSGLKVFLGLYQEELTMVNPDSLVDSRLHVWQFFRFKQEHHLELPLTVTHLLEKIETPVMRSHAHGGFRQLVTSLSEFLATEEGRVLFTKRTPKEMHLDELDMAKEVREQRTLEINHCEAILTQLGKNKPFATYNREREMLASDRQKFKETFEGFKVPVAAVAIPLYLGHSSTRDLYKCMVELAMNKVVLGPKEMAKLSRDYVKRLHLKNGHRLQIFKKFQRRHYFEAINKGAARFPYMGATGDTRKGTKTYRDNEMGLEFGVLENPHAVDMSQATEQEVQEWELTQGIAAMIEKPQGIAANIEKHKTGASYPCWLWFSPWDQVYLRAYEEIAANYMIANKIKFGNQSPFFINSKVLSLL